MSECLLSRRFITATLCLHDGLFFPSFRHVTEAAVVERAANDSLSDSKESLVLVQALVDRENQVKELVGDLNSL